MKSITLGSQVNSIGEYAFYKCSSLEEIKLPNEITSIGNGAFWNCTSITNCELSSEITSIGDYAFNNCSNLISIYIPIKLTRIGINAFYSCSSLSNVIFSSNKKWKLFGSSNGTNYSYYTSFDMTLDSETNATLLNSGTGGYTKFYFERFD